jgi:hypothetical protein
VLPREIDEVLVNPGVGLSRHSGYSWTLTPGSAGCGILMVRINVMKPILAPCPRAARRALRAPCPARPERLEWFRDQGFGLFIHWSLDSQLGSVISHSMVAASPDYLNRFIGELPRTFNPRKFNPADWAVLAKLAGIRYVVFTTKHHAGFTMFDKPPRSAS